MKSSSPPGNFPDDLRTQTIEALAARCEGPNQFENFARGVRASLSVSKEAVLKEEAKRKRARERKRRAKKPRTITES
jgi:hypothetical protein